MNRYLIDIRSATFAEIYNRGCFLRLEHEKFVHLWMHRDKNKIENQEHQYYVEIPRMGLHFHVEIQTGKLRSREHVGMIVDKNQASLGTLIGLQHGLLLHSDTNEYNGVQLEVDNLLLVPNTDKIDIKKTSHHQSVNLDLSNLLSPPYFAFSVNARLQELRAPPNQESWLYLALLHAMTSHCLPDPFTGLTGTESAMRLLQLGRTWSCKPFSENSRRILKSIAELAPKREFYPQHLKEMQKVKWNSHLPTSAAFDGLRLVVEMLIEDSLRLNILFEKKFDEMNNKKDDLLLVKRGYWRSRNVINSIARLTPESEIRIGGIPNRCSTWLYIEDDDNSQLEAARVLADSGHHWRGVLLQSTTSLWSIFEKRDEISEPESLLIDTVTDWRKIDSIDCFLSLYQMAQNVHRQPHLRTQFSMMLSFLAFKGEDTKLLSSLMKVAIHGIRDPPPEVRCYNKPGQTEFDLNEVKSIIMSAQLTPFSSFKSRRCYLHKPEEFIEKEYDRLSEKEFNEIESIVLSQWRLFNSVHLSSCMPEVITNIKTLEINLSQKFKQWYDNGELKIFINGIDKKIEIVTQDTLKQCSFNLPHPFFSSKIINQKIKSQQLTKRDDLHFSIRCISADQSAEKLFRSCKIVRNDPISKKTETIKTPLFSEQYLKKNISNKIFEKLIENLEISCEEFTKSEQKDDTFKIVEDCLKNLERIKKISLTWWSEVVDSMSPAKEDYVGQALVASGLWRRIVPLVIIPCILPLTSFFKSMLVCEGIPQAIIDRVGAMVVSWTAEQRAVRCLKLAQQNEKKENKPSVALCREFENSGHENWIPAEHPEWLILELECDFMARPLQIKIAQNMLDAKENSVQQLNMGEGKTSVIVPLLAAALANQKQLARITVLRSLFRTNFDALVDKLGGLLNRRVYEFPCRRDMQLPVLNLLDIYKECLEGRGLVVTTPEYRLSLDLKTLENCGKITDDGKKLYELQRWLRDHARDILDESDEILHVKYQVVYTLGEQMHIDGGELRWIACQEVLKLVSKMSSELFKKFGENCIECKNNGDGGVTTYSRIRLLSDNDQVYQTLCSWIVDAVFQYEVPVLSAICRLPQIDKDVLKKFILNNEVNELIADQKHLKDSVLNDQLLILRGMLNYEVLKMALQKRWRVNFGVNLLNKYRLMAVPFRAKDVAAERTEFGNPDVAIILTQISYYMSGLSYEQLDDVFRRLENTPNKEIIYEEWIEVIGRDKVPRSSQTLNGVNLKNYKQRAELYAVMRSSMKVIDFWLSRVVFPKESKQFPCKISASAWDLCLANVGLPTTGFSGTNDLRLLLPLTIKQQDLDEVLETNATVVSFLLRPENSKYHHLDASTSNHDFLDKVVKYDSRVILDVGALMLHLDNKNVAIELLKKYRVKSSDVSAAVYFDEKDKLMVCDLDERTCSLEVSPYSKKLDRCIVYLDDVHTRGTDLRFPPGCHACVTLGKGLTKDRFVQACMRMRLLGKGHSVSFWASNEVHVSIVEHMKLSNRDGSPETADIIRWSIKNTCDVIENGFLHWSNQGLARWFKMLAETSLVNKITNDRLTSNDLLKQLGDRCSENEIIKLENFYGSSRVQKSIPDIVQYRIERRCNAKFQSEEDLELTSKTLVDDFRTQIVAHCKQYVSECKHFAQLFDEEQERELEHELEEQVEFYRPNEQIAHVPKVSKLLLNLVKSADVKPCIDSGCIVDIEHVFTETCRISKVFQTDGWSGNIWTTMEFITVIEELGQNTDDFQRDPTWIIVVLPNENRSQTTLVMICPFEANELLPLFRSKERNPRTSLHMFSARFRRDQSIFLDKKSLIVPVPQMLNHLDSLLVAELTVFSAGLFFLNDDEQNAYCRFLGILPFSKRTEKQREAFENRLIDRMGFVTPKHREIVEPRLMVCNFHQNPVPMVIEILRTRGQCSDCLSTHVERLIHHGSLTDFSIN